MSRKVKLDFELRGTDELIRKLDALENAMSDRLEAAARAGALLVQNDAKIRAPKKTRTLARSIHMETAKKTADEVEVLVGTNVAYARRIELGFVGPDKLGRVYNQPAQPYLRPALYENQNKIMREMREAFAQTIRRVTR